MIEVKEKMDKEELNKLKGTLEQASKSVNLKEKEFLDLEKSATDKFLQEIRGYVPHDRYKNISEYLKIITNTESKINLLIIEGDAGLGKSTIVKSELKQQNKDIYYINSYTTSLAFYKMIYHNRYRHIILDDVTGIYGDEKGISILRALTNTEDVRYVKYESTSDKLDVPSNFIFYGSITILTNHITREMNESLLNRAIHRKIYFTLQEKFDLMEKIAKFNYPNVEVTDVLKFLKENVTDTTKNFSFRSVLKLIEFYKQNKKGWKNMAYEELENDEELVLIKKIKNYTHKHRNEIWVEETGKSIRTLQRKIKELNDRMTQRHLSQPHIKPKRYCKGGLNG